MLKYLYLKRKERFFFKIILKRNFLLKDYFFILLIKIFVIISFLICNNNIISNITFIISQLNAQIEFSKNEKFLEICNQKNKISQFKKIDNPKISIISPIYNSELFILRFLKSIQSQIFNDLEIILIDDCSIDNSIKLIKKYQKLDQRILLIKNKINKGTFMSRNLGTLFSKGQYLILPDPDDIISKNILKTCYIYALKYNYEIIRFITYIGSEKITFAEIVKNLGNKAVYQPELSSYLFYGDNKLFIIDHNINNKFIKKEIYIKALNNLKKYYLNLFINYSEDFLFIYFLFRTANSFYFYKSIGYYYIKNNLSITNNLFIKTQRKLKFSFFLLKLFFENSKNTNLEKDMINLFFSNLNKRANVKNFFESSFLKDFSFFYNVIKSLINCRFISKENKILLLEFKNLIKKKIQKI